MGAAFSSMNRPLPQSTFSLPFRLRFRPRGSTLAAGRHAMGQRRKSLGLQINDAVTFTVQDVTERNFYEHHGKKVIAGNVNLDKLL